MGKLHSMAESVVNFFHSLSTINVVIIIGLGALYAGIAGYNFLKKDRSGAEEGKDQLKRVAIALAIAIGSWVGIQALATWLQSLLN